MRLYCHFTGFLYHFVPPIPHFLPSDFLIATLSGFSGTKWYRFDKNAYELASSADLQGVPLLETASYWLPKWGRGGGWAGRGLGGPKWQADYSISHSSTS